MSAPTHVAMQTLGWALDQYISGDATAERTLVRVASVVYGQQAPTTDAPSGAGEASGARVAPVDAGDVRGPEKGAQGVGA